MLRFFIGFFIGIGLEFLLIGILMSQLLNWLDGNVQLAILFLPILLAIAWLAFQLIRHKPFGLPIGVMIGVALTQVLAFFSLIYAVGDIYQSGIM
jgi:hypothetical protein